MMKNIKDFKTEKEYPFTLIEGMLDENDGFATIEEHGPFITGERLLVLKDDRSDRTCSFVLTGMSGAGVAIWKCVFND